MADGQGLDAGRGIGSCRMTICWARSSNETPGTFGRIHLLHQADLVGAVGGTASLEV